MNRRSPIYVIVVTIVIALIFSIASLTSAATFYDVNGDGREGLAETIHSLRVATGLTPSSSSIVYVGAVGTALENGTALLTALNNISDTSNTHPYLLKIEPGVYDLGNNGLQMKENVDIEGSGENTTTITSTHSGEFNNESSATISGADSAELRFITIENRGGGDFSFAIHNYNASPVLTNVTAVAFGGTITRGVNNYSSSPLIKNSNISGTSNSIFNSEESSVRIVSTMLNGFIGGENFSCVAAYNSSFVELDSNCIEDIVPTQLY